VKDVQHHIDKIQEDPIDASGFPMPYGLALFLHPIFDSVSDGPDLNVGVGRAQDEKVRHRGKSPQIHDDDIHRFLGQCEFSYSPSEYR
jgi:hypothetical protein